MVKIMENPIKMDDLEVPLFLETPIFGDFFRLAGRRNRHGAIAGLHPFLWLCPGTQLVPLAG